MSVAAAFPLLGAVVCKNGTRICGVTAKSVDSFDRLCHAFNGLANGHLVASDEVCVTAAELESVTVLAVGGDVAGSYLRNGIAVELLGYLDFVTLGGLAGV